MRRLILWVALLSSGCATLGSPTATGFLNGLMGTESTPAPVLLTPSAPFLAAGHYTLTATRLDTNLYQDTTSKIIIETRNCYEYVFFADAVLTWQGYPYGLNSLVFRQSGTTCDVIALR